MRSVQSYGLLLILLASAFGANGAHAQSYPSKPVRILTTGAGSGTDFVARIVATELSAPLGQPVVIENRPATVMLTSGVAKAKPDGYTLMIWGGALWLAPLFEEANYDVMRDFAPIATLSRSPSILVVHPSLPVRSVAELIKLVKSRPGEFNYSSGPTGSSSQIAGELLKSMAGIDFAIIMYKGGSQITPELLSGQVQITIGGAVNMLAQTKAGKLRALATSGAQRSVMAPDLPTIAETLPGFVSEALFAFWAPAKTPDAVIRRLSQDTMRLLEKPEVREQLLKTGQEPAGGPPEQLLGYVKSETARVGKMIKDAGIKPRD